MHDKAQRTSESEAIGLLATGEHECPYLMGHTARTAFVDPRTPLDHVRYRQLMTRGFRRSGQFLYRPACPACQACRSLRIPVAEFRPRRRHRRCWRRNRDLEVATVPAGFRTDHYDLYARYVASRHPGGGMDQPTPESYRSFLHAQWCDTEFMEFRENGVLRAVAVCDRLADALSAVYTFYDTDCPERGLGTFAILAQIRMARVLGLDWLYLGYWIARCSRMDYKAEFLPHEVLAPDGQWTRISD